MWVPHLGPVCEIHNAALFRVKEALRSQREDVQILIHTRGGRIRLCSEEWKASVTSRDTFMVQHLLQCV